MTKFPKPADNTKSGMAVLPQEEAFGRRASSTVAVERVIEFS
jgi:hypothetical protein